MPDGFEEITADGPDTEAPAMETGLFTDPSQPTPESNAQELDRMETGIDYPDGVAVDVINGVISQAKAKAVQDFTGTAAWFLLQFEGPESIRFGIRQSQPEVSAPALLSVMDRLCRELRTIDAMQIEAQQMANMQRAYAQAQEDDSDNSEYVDMRTGLVIIANREQRRHPEKYGLARRPKAR